MRKPHKKKSSPMGNEVKAGLIAKHGTIAAYIRQTGHKAGTVYAAIKGRRNGPLSRLIQGEALR
ncbi:hypothetical protein K0B96_06525 [Horticoccus luteus]|uniref:Uncharacterized protein n=1 Tax=Horticoccus luteus TaxID=2862869 RepID=A0A8F9TW06_9BACT|nr:hypothetical protein [Horticoccus luteus]QYM80264.1 hypothetical protein K0B96_06525 [Horticoccus luteus]